MIERCCISKWFEQSIEYLTRSKSEEGASRPDYGVTWLNKLTIETLGSKCSRNNTPSKAHQLTKLVHRNSCGEKQAIVIVCERDNAVACAAAIARAFPLFTAKTGRGHNDSNKPRHVQVSFLFKQEANYAHASTQEIECFATLARSIRLTAKIVDTPCADMTTNHFLDVKFLIFLSSPSKVTNKNLLGNKACCERTPP